MENIVCEENNSSLIFLSGVKDFNESQHDLVLCSRRK